MLDNFSNILERSLKCVEGWWKVCAKKSLLGQLAAVKNCPKTSNLASIHCSGKQRITERLGLRITASKEYTIILLYTDEEGHGISGRAPTISLHLYCTIKVT